MRESVIQTTINKFLYWLAKRCVTALYKRTRFWTCSWGLDENTDLYLISEESYHDRHRFGVHEEKYADAPRLEVTKEEVEKIVERIKDAPLKIERLADVYDYKGHGKWERSER